MKIDIDAARGAAEAQAKVLPWDLTLTIRGVDYKVRPLTNADLVAIGGMGRVTDARKAVELLAPLFQTPLPQTVLELDEVAAVVTAIAMGWQAHLKKKSQALGRAVGTQIDAEEARETKGTTGRT